MFNEEGEVGCAVGVFGPAKAVRVHGEGVGFFGGEGDAGAGFDFGFEEVDTHAVDGVFEAGFFAVGAVTVIALCGDDGFGDLADLIGGNEAEIFGDLWIGAGGVVGAAHAATHEHVVAFEFAVLSDGNEAEVITVYVDIIMGGDGDGDFKFSRKIGGAVDRFDLFFDVGDFLFVEPDFVIGLGFGEQVGADGAGVLVDAGVEIGFDGVGVA